MSRLTEAYIKSDDGYALLAKTDADAIQALWDAADEVTRNWSGSHAAVFPQLPLAVEALRDLCGGEGE